MTAEIGRVLWFAMAAIILYWLSWDTYISYRDLEAHAGHCSQAKGGMYLYVMGAPLFKGRPLQSGHLNSPAYNFLLVLSMFYP